ncbi:hypothetical protein ACHWQZ_G005093 [Mnemiopsis leidyi]
MRCKSLFGTLVETSSELILSSDHASFEEGLANENILKPQSKNSESYSVISYANSSSKQQLLDRIDDLLKKITFNNELIETFDTFFKNQSSTAHDLRLELQELSLCSDSALSAGQMSPTWDYQAIFEESENSPNFDIPNSTQELKLSFSDKELISYLVDREREILRLQHCVANNSNRETDKTALRNIEESYIKRYWDLWEQNKQLKSILSEIRAKENSLVDQLQEQEQLTVFYAYLNLSTERDSKEHELTEDSYSEED